MRILVSGVSGLIGSALAQRLQRAGHTVVSLVRHHPRSDEIGWDGRTLGPASVEGFDGIVHLAGESIAGRWTAARKARIRDSRVQGTRALADAISRAGRRPKVLVSASAIGIYGDRGDEILREDSLAGSDFLAGVAREWEEATGPAVQAGVRVVLIRTGIVLSTRGGALARMLPPFRMGAGGRIGSGHQWMSWISLEDEAGTIEHALASESVRGPLNTVAPQPVTNTDFTHALGRALHRPTLFPLPAFMVKLIFGEMGEALLLGSQRVSSDKLQASGYQFRHPELQGALTALLQSAA